MPLLADHDTRPAQAAIREIGLGVAECAAPVDGESPGETSRMRRWPNAFAGLFHAQADIAEVIPDGMDTCADIVEQCLDRKLHADVVGLYGGWAGLGWVTSYLNADDDFVGAHVDGLLTRALRRWPAALGYDLIRGLVGVGVYFIERLPRESAVRGLTLVLAALEATATRTDEGTTWFTAPEFLPVWQRERAPNGYYNLGVAHGVPGVCWLLGKLCLEGIERGRAEPLLLQSLRWLRSTQPDPASAELPSWIAPGIGREPNRRMAWCYGPLGASAVALEAAKAIKDEASMAWARTLARACAAVEPSDARIQDAGLCHGAAGNAQIFCRLHDNTGESGFRVAALRWLDATLAYRHPGQGIGGYRMWGEVEHNQQGWLDDASFLTGSGGVGLALLSAVTDIEPAWDRLLLLS